MQSRMFLEGQDAMVAFWLSSSFAEWSFIRQVATNHESVACCGMLVKHGQTWSNHVHWSILLRQICSHFVFAQVDVDVLRFVVPVVSRIPLGWTANVQIQLNKNSCRSTSRWRCRLSKLWDSATCELSKHFHRESSKGTLRWIGNNLSSSRTRSNSSSQSSSRAPLNLSQQQWEK